MKFLSLAPRGILQVIMVLLLAACNMPAVAQPTPAVPPAESTATLAFPTRTPEQAAPAQPAAATAEPTAVQTPAPVVQPIAGVEVSPNLPANLFDAVRDTGAFWVRQNGLVWQNIEAVEGQRDWSSVAPLEQQMKELSARGAQIILIVRGTPSWAQAVAGSDCSPVLAEKLPAFAAFLREAVARYSVPPYNVKYWEIGNEPDVDPSLVPQTGSPFGCWGNIQDPFYGGGNYAEALKAAYPAIKSADPQAKIVTGGLLMDCNPNDPPEKPHGSGRLADCTPAKFIEGVLAAGGGDYMDAVNFHAYDYSTFEPGVYYNAGWKTASTANGPALIAKAEYLRGLLEKYDHPEIALINSEVALICAASASECSDSPYEANKTIFIAQAFAAARAHGLLANIWYSFQGWRGSGLLDANQNPLPAYAALRFSASKLNAAKFERSLTEIEGVQGYEFINGAQRLWVVWAVDGVQHRVTLPAPPSGVYDAVGNAQASAQDLAIGPAPLYIEWTGP